MNPRPDSETEAMAKSTAPEPWNSPDPWAIPNIRTEARWRRIDRANAMGCGWSIQVGRS